MSVVDHRTDANLSGKPHGGNISGFCQCLLQGYRTGKPSIIVVRCIWPDCGDESLWCIENNVQRGCAPIHSSGVDVRLKRGTCLAECLCGAIEFGRLEIPATNHSLNLSASIINRQQSALNLGMGGERSF